LFGPWPRWRLRTAMMRTSSLSLEVVQTQDLAAIFPEDAKEFVWIMFMVVGFDDAIHLIRRVQNVDCPVFLCWVTTI